MDRLSATTSEGVGLIVRAVIVSEISNPTYVITHHQRHRQTDDMRSQDRAYAVMHLSALRCKNGPKALASAFSSEATTATALQIQV